MPCTFGEVLDAAHEYRIRHGMADISEGEAMDLALEAQGDVRAEVRAEGGLLSLAARSEILRSRIAVRWTRVSRRMVM